MTTAVIFDDNFESLGPLTDLRPSFLVRTGALTTLDRIQLLLESMNGTAVESVWVSESRRSLTTEQVAAPVNSLKPGTEDVLLINGRAVLQPSEMLDLKLGHALVDRDSTSIIAARTNRVDAQTFLNGCNGSKLPSGVKGLPCADDCLLSRPWDAIKFRDQTLDLDLALIKSRPTQEIPPGVVAIGADDITISPEAVIYPTVVLDAGSGPIVIEDDVTIRPGSIIIGPAFIGRGSTILDRALIKAHTAIGPVCKITGEVGGTIIQGHTNKAHDGHIGDAWIGEWVNFGAGTTNSNLLNTYGEVVSQTQCGAPRERTGLQYFGGVVGDHVKFAICSRIMTGSVFGTGAMIAMTSHAPAAVPRFAWITDERPLGAQSYRLNKFLDVARNVMGRRGVTLSAAYGARLTELFEAEART